MTDQKIECLSCMDTEDMMPGLRMCKVCYFKAFDELKFDENGNPVFQDMEQFTRFGEALSKYGLGKTAPVATKSVKVSKVSKRNKKPADPVDNGRVTVANLDHELIFESRHFYVRKGDTFGQVKEDAKQAKALSNESNTVVFYHDHFFSFPCNDKCQEM